MSTTLAHREHVEQVATQEAASDGTQPFIAGSWRRCLNEHQLDPDTPPSIQVLESHHLREHTQRHDYLLGVAQQELVDLYNQMQGSGYSIFLTDAAGIVLQQVADPNYIQNMRRAGLRVGADWSEQANGTNGVGTCIVERRPLTVHLGDHFHTKHTQLSCSAAPIRDPAGELLAVLDSSAARRAAPRDDHQTLGLVRNTAAFIEGLYFLRLHRGDIIVHLSTNPDIVPQPRNAMIAISASGRVAGANERALIMLGAPGRDALLGREIQHLLDLRRCPINAANAGQVQQLRLIDRGKLVFATWQAAGPVGASPRHNANAAPAPAPHPPHAGAPAPLALASGHPPLDQRAQHLVELLDQRVAVLLQGETGTGKDHIARALHRASQRGNGRLGASTGGEPLGAPFVAIDCDSATEQTFEQLPGTPSGADASCGAGTLFFDNVDLLDEALQAKLVEYLHQRERATERAGGPPAPKLLCAARGELRARVDKQLFREDLFYRLAQFTLEIPPLREREQRGQLIERLLARENARQGKRTRLGASAKQQLGRYHWPGNIRELISALRSAVTLCHDGEITPEHLPTSLFAPAPTESAPPPLAATADGAWSGLEAAELEVLLQELRRQRWNISATANSLNMSRNTIYRKMKKYSISPEQSAP